jgi:hypothetical protein
MRRSLSFVWTGVRGSLYAGRLPSGISALRGAGAAHDDAYGRGGRSRAVELGSDQRRLVWITVRGYRVPVLGIETDHADFIRIGPRTRGSSQSGSLRSRTCSNSLESESRSGVGLPIPPSGSHAREHFLRRPAARADGGGQRLRSAHPGSVHGLRFACAGTCRSDRPPAGSPAAFSAVAPLRADILRPMSGSTPRRGCAR